MQWKRSQRERTRQSPVVIMIVTSSHLLYNACHIKSLYAINSESSVLLILMFAKWEIWKKQSMVMGTCPWDIPAYNATLWRTSYSLPPFSFSLSSKTIWCSHGNVHFHPILSVVLAIILAKIPRSYDIWPNLVKLRIGRFCGKILQLYLTKKGRGLCDTLRQQKVQ